LSLCAAASMAVFVFPSPVGNITRQLPLAQEAIMVSWYSLGTKFFIPTILLVSKILIPQLRIG